MRRVAMILVALVLVNLPFAHQTLSGRQLARSGKEVVATLVRARTINGRSLVDYRLPASVDPARSRYSARVDESTYAQAKQTQVLLVRVVPGRPAVNRPTGEVRSNLFAVVALACDVGLALIVVLLWRRWRRWSWHEVVAVGDGVVSLASQDNTLTVSAPPGWVARVQPGDRVSGSMHLAAEGDLLPGLPLSGFEQVHGSSYVVRGRVLDARAGRVVLELAGGSRLVVETGPHRIRADIRDSTEVHGTLCFTPTVARA